MNYFSLNHRSPNVVFREAVIHGIAPDKGLYFPKDITPLPNTFFEDIDSLTNEAIAFECIRQFVSPDIPDEVLKTIIDETLSFDFPIVNINETISTLELFHGPTMAFKDVGARFMARCLGYFNKDSSNEVTVLVATSGDTGGAVANGFLGVEGVRVVILYPSGRVSDIQEKQLTTLKKNITALEVNGSFDDCQEMVKRAFLDSDITGTVQLTSANSINVARWLPQMFYYFFAYKTLRKSHPDLVFSVPSGNFGNICAGIMGQKLGLPVRHFIAANNANDVVTEYLKTERYQPKPSVQTISNAMDVGNPSNFVRILEIYNNDFNVLKNNLSSYSFSDSDTQSAMQELYNDFNYVADPHGAVGYLGCKRYLKSDPGAHCVFLETAHPSKFLDVVEDTIKQNIVLPPQIISVMEKKKNAIAISSYEELKEFLINN